MELNKRLYAYSGPVMIFDRCVADRWSAETWAVSASKAKSNLIFRFKKENNLLAGTGGVKLVGNVQLVRED